MQVKPDWKRFVCEAKSKKYTDRLNDAIKLYNSNLINNIKKDKEKRSFTNSNSAETVRNEFKNSNLKSKFLLK